MLGAVFRAHLSLVSFFALPNCLNVRPMHAAIIGVLTHHLGQLLLRPITP